MEISAREGMSIVMIEMQEINKYMGISLLKKLIVRNHGTNSDTHSQLLEAWANATIYGAIFNAFGGKHLSFMMYV